MTRRYARRMSALERYSLVIHEIYRYHVDGIIEGQGRVDAQALQAAADAAAEANPGIRVRLRGALGFTRWVDSGIAPRVRVLPAATWDGTSERDAPFLEERLDPLHGGPVADILLVPGAGDTLRLVFRTVHAAVDGRGLMHWGAEVFRALRGEPLLGSHSTLTDQDVQRQDRDRVAAEPPLAPAPAIPVLALGRHEGPLRYAWRRVRIEREVSQLLPKTAVFLAEWARRREAGDVRFTIPVDYRGLRTSEMSVGNLLGYLRLVVDEGAGARELMQQLHQGIRDHEDCRSLQGARWLRWTPFAPMVRQLRGAAPKLLYTTNAVLPSGGIVSMGRLELADFSLPGFQARTLSGIPGSVGKLNVVFVAFPGATTVTFAAPAAYDAHGQLDELTAAYRAHFETRQRAAA